MSDFVYVLAPRGSIQMNKQFRLLPNGTIQKTSFDPQSCPDFGFERHALTSFDALCSLLQSLRKQPQRALVRGEYIGDPEALLIRRRKRGEGASFKQAEGHHWVCVDIDKFSAPWDDVVCDGPDDVDYHLALAHEARRSLPAPFHHAHALCHLSSSYGYGGDFSKFKGHLWFWFDRPVCDDALRHWKELTDASDAALYDCIQIHYTADPTFDNLEPFVPEEARMFELHGESTVVAPDFLTTLSALPKPEPKVKEKPAKAPSPPPTPTPAPVVAKAALAREQDSSILIDAPPQDPTLSQLEYGKKSLAGIIADAQGWAPGNRHHNIYKKACHLQRLMNSSLITQQQRDETVQSMLRGLYGDDPVQLKKEMTTALDAFEACQRESYDLQILCPTRSGSEVRKDYEARAARGEGPAYVMFCENGTPKAHEDNVKAVVEYRNITLGFDIMSRESVYEDPEFDDLDAPTAYITSLSKLKLELTSAGIYRGKEWLEDCLNLLYAKAPRYHAALKWMTSVPWDGVDRIETLFQTLQLRPHATAQQRKLYFTLFRTWLISAARAAAVPVRTDTGILAQGILVLQGPQNAGKSRWFSCLCGVVEGEPTKQGSRFIASGEDPINKGDPVRFYEQITSRWITEFAEIDSMIRDMDEGTFKRFITCATDRWMPKWGRKTGEYPRRSVFAGTVNQENFMKDPTGNRRLWVIQVQACNVSRTNDELEHRPGPYIEDIDMQQLWAQVNVLERKGILAEPHFLSQAVVDELDAANRMLTTTGIHEVDVTVMFEGVDRDTVPSSQWLTGAEARQHYLSACGVDEKDPQANALWLRASADIQKRWGDRVKNKCMRYPVVKKD